MYTIKNETIFCYDVDGTLISSRRELEEKGDHVVINPYTKEQVYFKPNKAHVNLLKETFGRGQFIIVWSASGVLWAEEIVRHLGIEKYVNVVMTKPMAYCDDKPCNEWLKNLVFLSPGER